MKQCRPQDDVLRGDRAADDHRRRLGHEALAVGGLERRAWQDRARPRSAIPAGCAEGARRASAPFELLVLDLVGQTAHAKAAPDSVHHGHCRSPFFTAQACGVASLPPGAAARTARRFSSVARGSLAHAPPLLKRRWCGHRRYAAHTRHSGSPPPRSAAAPRSPRAGRSLELLRLRTSAPEQSPNCTSSACLRPGEDRSPVSCGVRDAGAR